MLGIVLIYVGVVLILNGIGRLYNVDAKSSAVFNVFTGMLSFILNIVAVIQGNYFAAGTGLLFGFTYLYIAARSIFNLDGRLYGWYCLFVAINTITLAFIDDNTLTVNVARLRRKLEKMGLENVILTKKGIGYMVEA